MTFKITKKKEKDLPTDNISNYSEKVHVLVGNLLNVSTQSHTYHDFLKAKL